MFNIKLNIKTIAKIHPKSKQTFDILICDYLANTYTNELYKDAYTYVFTNVENISVYNHLELITLCNEWINAMELVKNANKYI